MSIERDDQALSAEDSAARMRALDVSTSFVVQAPAGSGKTELLIQRYMALLARVDEPEEIVALTFTRKAAGEMRERVLAALVAAAAKAPVDDREHKRVTRRLAEDVLAQDARRGWSIATHPARLRMQTFDALATALARRAPLAAGLGPHPGYVDDARPLYLRAAEEALADAGADDAAWRSLLVHLDNQAGQLTTLIAGMLARRDQWLRQVGGMTNAELRQGLEQALRAEILDVLRETHASFPSGVASEIARCARHAAGVFSTLDDGADFSAELVALAEAGGLPAPTLEALPLWRTLGVFLLAKRGTHFKRAISRRDGFEAVGRPPGADERRARKQAMESLCTSLDALPGLAGALAAASRMPDPVAGDETWRIVEALLDVLRGASARLLTVFAAERRVDFVQANLAAISALGDEEAPSELLLQLDANVKHLLVDEFQDTSYVQLALLERLTAGWSPGDGRTLFAVGDPMQSIYRFREAEVAFFLRATETGRVAGLDVERLTLRRNFRSQANLVQWCNDAFAQVLGQVRDAARGVVPFEAATPTRDPLEGVTATLDLQEDGPGEAAALVRRIRQAQAAGSDDIAVLVRARSHLAHLLPALRREGIAFVAVELDHLAERQAVLDLASLTHAILQPADRVAWLAVLRAPWCGLALADLCAIADAAKAGRWPSLARVLDEATAVPGLSQEGAERVARVRDPLLAALEARGQASVADRVRGAWLALGGPALFDDPIDLDTAALYFGLLASHAADGDLADWDAFVVALDALLASPAAPARGGVQVMTMHKAKGLEFDTVILPGLARDGNAGDAPLMRWRRREEGLLIAPAKARGGDSDALYRYLGELADQAEDAELGRLLYVACTRAKSRLHLLGAPGTRRDKDTDALGWKDPPSSSSLAKLWTTVQRDLPMFGEAANDATAATSEPPPLRRLPVDADLAQPDDALPIDAGTHEREIAAPAFDWVRETTRHIGTVAHRLLARIAHGDTATWTTQAIDALRPRAAADLASVGFTADELPRASERVLEAVRRTLSDPRGRWLFDPSHADARSEWGIAGVDDGAIVHVVVDRTFVADGERWIVDFKTGAHEGGDVAGFLDREAERYGEQLRRYGRLMQAMEGRPVRLALYYPFVEGGFREIGPVEEARPNAGPQRQAELDLG